MLFACAGTLSLWAAQPADGSPSGLSPSEIRSLRQQIADQKEEIKRLESAIQNQQNALDRAGAPAPNADQQAALVPASSGTGVSGQHEEIKSSPLSLSIGNTRFTPLGFVDATFYGRSTNVGSGIGTNFGGIPFNNSTAGHLTEANFSDQNSRIGFRVDSTLSGAKVLGYFEADFLGNQPGNVFVTSNANTFRMRNIFVDVQKGMFEFLGGQDWSLATPNRNGLSPLPSDIFYTQNMDTNYQLGPVWSLPCLSKIRNSISAAQGALSATAVAFPSALSAALTPQFNNGGTNYSAPNLHPDIIVKAAYDPHVGGKHLHFEPASLRAASKTRSASGVR